MRNPYPRLSRIEFELHEELLGAPLSEFRRRGPEIFQELAKLVGVPVPETPGTADLNLVFETLEKKTQGNLQQGCKFLREAVQNLRRS